LINLERFTQKSPNLLVEVYAGGTFLGFRSYIRRIRFFNSCGNLS